MKTAIAVAALAALVTLTGCSGTDQSEPATTTVTEAEAEPTLSADEHREEITNSVLEKVWNDSTTEDQQAICDGMALIPEEMVDAFMAEVTDETLTREQVRDFFDGKCFG